MNSPPSAGELQDVLVQLRARVGSHFEAAVERSPDAFSCRAGCDRCCHQRFGVFEVEAAAIRCALRELAERDPATRQRVRLQADDPEHEDRCALLVDGRCAVYGARPMICRTHGLPILTEAEDDEHGTRVDHCPLNFQTGAPPPASVLRLSVVNQPFALLARLWDGGQRVALASLARAPDRSATEPTESVEKTLDGRHRRE